MKGLNILSEKGRDQREEKQERWWNRIRAGLKTGKQREQRSIRGITGHTVLDTEMCDPDHLPRQDLLPTVRE